ncbi:hypothetical protein QQS21_007106 [Conoideocrella luteorostrata]|uniref:NACHT domain-containing protein n=1 Tax=Conoideocrella luteorostrata TaxID=1105319 RepID=A0AAJ0CQM6_9HYPO|nr:hypothetical protein QQS21_007106 [Conoideocrella luteorostrata]
MESVKDEGSQQRLLPGAGSQSSSSGTGGYENQFNISNNVLNTSTGNGNHFPGATLSGPVYFGTEKRLDLLQDCLKSLAFSEMDSRSKDIDDAATGTCQWIIQNEVYTQWAASNQGLLWIKGKPGSGKSTLLRYLCNAEKLPGISESTLILSFFFHGRGTELQRSPLGLFRSLLFQLKEVNGALSEAVDTFQYRCKNIGKPGKAWQWHLRDVQDFFKSSLMKALQTQPICLLIDALDECGKESAIRLIEVFKLLLEGLPSELKEFHICITCRHYPILSPTDMFEITMDRENANDISAFVQEKFSSDWRQIPPAIPDLITTRANGIFLWARLVVGQVLDPELESAKQMEFLINSVPPDLYDLYIQIISNMDSNSLKLIQWVCFATRPLKVGELRWAMLVDPNCPYRSLQECENAGDYASTDEHMIKRVHKFSCGLVEVLYNFNVQFIHQSVKEFFVPKGLSALAGILNPAQVTTPSQTDIEGNAHYMLSRTCIRYFTMDEIAQSTSHKSYSLEFSFPLLHYATTSWAGHAKQSERRGTSQNDLLIYFDWPSETLIQQWAQIYDRFNPWNRLPLKGIRMLHIVSLYGLLGPLQVILQRSSQVNTEVAAKDNAGRVPLSYAAGNGYEAAVKELLATGKVGIAGYCKTITRFLPNISASVDIRDNSGRTPLLWAAKNRHEVTVLLLLEKGASIDAKDKDGRTPLSWTANNGNAATVQLLLERGASIDAKDKDGRTPLSWTANNGNAAIVQLLLEKGASIDAKDKDSRTPLSWAAGNRTEAIIQLLLEKGASIDAKDKDSRTPLSWAATYRNAATVQLLLKRGASIDAKDKDGRTPLSWAAQYGNKAIIQLLLEKGASIDAKDKDSRTPLSWAAQYGNKAIIQLLLEKGASIDAKDKDSRTPLLWAAKNGHEATVQLLLKNGASIDAKDENGQTPLLWAAKNGHKATVQLLLERGASIDAKDMDGRTPLSWAAADRHNSDNIRLLLENGASIDSKDKNDRTPLSWATKDRNNSDNIRLLLDNGASIDAEDENGQTPLLWAAKNGHEDDVQLLLENGASIDAKDENGQTPLLWAAKNGHEDAVQLLLERGASIDAKDKDGRTPLSWVTKYGNEAINQLLLENGASIDAKDKNDRTPLSWATKDRYNPHNIRLLLDNGASIDAKDENGQTPLLWAAKNGHEATVQLLLERGANIHAKDKDGQTPLLWATKNRHEATVYLLLEKGANLYDKNT